MKKKSEKLIHLKRICIDSAFYKTQYPNEQAEEARPLLFCSYTESELDETTRSQFEKHLAKCASCSRAFKEFEDITEFRLEDPVQTAVCPSSEMLDCFIYDNGLLSASQIQRIEIHLRDCEMCAEELNWLKDIDKRPQQRAHFSPTWMQSLMAAAAALILAVSVFFFWEKSSSRVADEQLSSLAVIQEPAQINYASLLEGSEPLREDLQPLFDQALEAFRTHRFNDASHRLETVRQSHPRHAAALYLLAYSYYKMNKLQKAFELCNLSESIHPHSYERCIFLVKMALKTRHYERARLEIASLYHAAPDAPEVKHLYHEIMRLTDSRRL